MLPEIEKLLILQDRDQRIRTYQLELAAIPVERKAKEKYIAESASRLEGSKFRLREIEVDRKKLELEANGKRDQIIRYKQQQLQTRKNEEYAALGHEIGAAEKFIRGLEDRELELMEEAESLRPATAAAEAIHSEERKRYEVQIRDLDAKKGVIETAVTGLQTTREPLTEGIDPDVLDRYQRLFKSKNGVVIVAIDHDVCTGCHVKAPTQTALEVRAEKSLVHCPNCGRVLFLPA